MASRPAPRTTPEPPAVPGARWVPLTRAKFTLVDEADYERVAAFSWQAVEKRGHWYAQRIVGGRDRRTCLPMHRFIVGALPGEDVDHKRGEETLDNRRENLRRCTPTQNRQNSRVYRKRTCAFKGVTTNANQRLSRPWQASIKANGKRIHLGRFATAEEAARAYDTAAVKHFGEFARLNFPEVRCA